MSEGGENKTRRLHGFQFSAGLFIYFLTPPPPPPYNKVLHIKHRQKKGTVFIAQAPS